MAQSKPNSSATAPAQPGTTSPSISMVPPIAQLVPLRLNLPQPAYARYAGLAAAVGMDVEEYLAEHLTQTQHINVREAGIWLDAAQAKRLQTLVGGGRSANTDHLISKLEAMARFKLEDLTVALDADVLNRIGHNYLVRKGSLTPTQFAAKEMVNGVRAAVGLMPKRG